MATGRHGRKFFCQIFFAKFFGESWLAFHETGVLGDAPLGPQPGLEVDLTRLTTSAVAHEWRVTNVDAVLATLDQLYSVSVKGPSWLGRIFCPPRVAAAVAGRPRTATPRRLGANDVILYQWP